MLTTEEIKQIVDAHAEVFATKIDFADFRDEMRSNYSNLLTAVEMISPSYMYIGRKSSHM